MVLILHDLWRKVNLLDKLCKLKTFEKEGPAVYHFHELFCWECILIDAGPSVKEVFVQNVEDHRIIIIVLRDFLAAGWQLLRQNDHETQRNLCMILRTRFGVQLIE